MTPEEFVTRVFTVMETPTGLEQLSVETLAIGKMMLVRAAMDEYLAGLPHVSTTSTMTVPRWVFEVQARVDEPPC